MFMLNSIHVNYVNGLMGCARITLAQHNDTPVGHITLKQVAQHECVVCLMFCFMSYVIGMRSTSLNITELT